MLISNNPDGSTSQNFDHKMKARRNRRSRRLQKKNSLDVQFRRRFSMLRDNAASNNIYNASISNGFNGFTDLDATNMGGMASALGRDSRASSMMPGGGGAPSLGPRASMGNISAKLLDKKFNKILINMQQNLPQSGSNEDGLTNTNQADKWNALPNKHKKNRKRKAPVLAETQNV